MSSPALPNTTSTSNLKSASSIKPPLNTLASSSLKDALKWTWPKFWASPNGWSQRNLKTFNLSLVSATSITILLNITPKSLTHSSFFPKKMFLSFGHLTRIMPFKLLFTPSPLPLFLPYPTMLSHIVLSPMLATLPLVPSSNNLMP